MESENIYFERQQGGLCQMHALNMFYGNSHYTSKTFKELRDNFDFEMKQYKLPPCAQFDSVTSTCETLVVHSLEQHKYATKYSASTSGQCPYILNLIDPNVNALFVFNSNHIWLFKCINEIWYELDSLQTQPFNVTRTFKQKIARLCQQKCFFIVPWKTQKASEEIEQSITSIRSHIQSTNLINILTFLVNEINAKKLITSIEVQISSFYKLHHFLHGKTDAYVLFLDYLHEFSNDPGNNEFLLCKLPILIQFILLYSKKVPIPLSGNSMRGSICISVNGLYDQQPCTVLIKQ